MRNEIASALIALSALASPCFADGNVRLLDHGGAVWSGGYSELTVPESGFDLTADTTIKVDKLFINGRLRTLGYKLTIEAREVKYGPRGKITAYEDAPAADATPTPDRGGPPAKATAHTGPFGLFGVAGTNGANGHDGAHGAMGNQNPGAVRTFAYLVDGNPIVDGTGQAGGNGAAGGTGQPGGEGGNGKDAYAKCDGILGNGHSAGWGGAGGKSGLGGRGGNGGNGGAPVGVTFLQGFSSSNAIGATLVSRGGKSGLGGAVGAIGTPGRGGRGGRAARDESKAWFVTVCSLDYPEGRHGEDYQITSNDNYANINGRAGTNGREDQHDIGSTKELFNNLAYDRVNALQDLAAFQFARDFELAYLDSVRLLDERYFSSRAKTIESLTSATPLGSGPIAPEIASRVAGDWADQFLAPLQEKLANDRTLNASQRAAYRSAVQTGLLILALFNKPEARTARQLYEKLRNSRQYKFETAGDRCDYYRLSYVSRQPALGDSANMFFVPACEPGALRTLAVDPFGPIALQRALEPVVSPESAKGGLNFKEYRYDPHSLTLLEKSWMRLWNFIAGTPAYAAENDVKVIVITNRPMTPDTMIQTVPSVDRRTDAKGVIESYATPAEGAVSPARLGYHLRTLAYQLEALEKARAGSSR